MPAKKALPTNLPAKQDAPTGADMPALRAGIKDAIGALACRVWERDRERSCELIRTAPTDIATIAGPNPSPLEELAAARVYLTGQHVCAMELLYWAEGPWGDNRRIVDVNIRHLQAAHKMHLAALRTLADIRRLAVVQVNIAHNQIVAPQVAQK